MKIQRIPALDGVRGLAILMVLLFHAERFGSAAPPVYRGGFLGVELFFVLSGFLISRLLLAEYARSESIRLGAFYLRRARRLFPALFVFLGAAWLFAATSSDAVQAEKIRRGIVASILYYANWPAAYDQDPFEILNHTWSLSIEEQFYLFWPLLLLALLRLRTPSYLMYGIMAGLIAVSAVLRSYYATMTGTYMRAYFGTDSRLDGLMLGALLAFLLRDGVLAARHKGSKALAGAGVVAFCIIIASGFTASMVQRAVYFGGLLVVSFAAAVLIASLVLCPSARLTRFFERPWLVWLGLISYSLYLWHPLINGMLSERTNFAHGWEWIAMSCAGSMLAATCSYYIIERPCLQISISPSMPRK